MPTSSSADAETYDPFLTASGAVVYTENGFQLPHPRLFKNGTSTALPDVPGARPAVFHVANNLEQFVGRALVLFGAPGETRVNGVYGDSAGTHELQVPNELLEITSIDINDRGQIAGSKDFGDQARGVIWNDHTAAMRVLNDLIDPALQWNLTTADKINNAGQIAGTGAFGAPGNEVFAAYLLSPASGANLQLGIIAPAQTTSQAALTYAVNIRNFGPAVATGVRAEFLLPQGFTIVDTLGWQACTTTLSTVTCTAAELASGEQRAFLINVTAPLATGRFDVSARVLSDSVDPDYVNNEKTATTLVVEP